MIYVVDTWQPLIRYLLLWLEVVIRPIVEDECLLGMKKHCISSSLQYIRHIDSVSLHNKEARWAVSLSFSCSRCVVLCCVCICKYSVLRCYSRKFLFVILTLEERSYFWIMVCFWLWCSVPEIWGKQLGYFAYTNGQTLDFIIFQCSAQPKPAY